MSIVLGKIHGKGAGEELRPLRVAVPNVETGEGAQWEVCEDGV